jgi:hypothetical protein
MKVQVIHGRLVPGLPRGQAVSRSHGIAYTEINVDADPAASAEVMRHVGKRAIPQLVIDGEWFQPYKPGRGLLSTNCTSASGFLADKGASPRTMRVGASAEGPAVYRLRRNLLGRHGAASWQGVLPLIERYTRPAMGRIWTEENKYRCWLQVESAASTVLAEDGVIPAAAAEAIAPRPASPSRAFRRSRPR